jgi:hypothetical protein
MVTRPKTAPAKTGGRRPTVIEPVMQWLATKGPATIGAIALGVDIPVEKVRTALRTRQLKHGDVESIRNNGQHLWMLADPEPVSARETALTDAREAALESETSFSESLRDIAAELRNSAVYLDKIADNYADGVTELRAAELTLTALRALLNGDAQ